MLRLRYSNLRYNYSKTTSFIFSITHFYANFVCFDLILRNNQVIRTIKKTG